MGRYSNSGHYADYALDEAHHLEDVATSYFGGRLSCRALERTLGRLQSPRHEARGVLPAILTALRALSRPEERIIAEQAERWITDRKAEGSQRGDASGTRLGKRISLPVSHVV